LRRLPGNVGGLRSDSELLAPEVKTSLSYETWARLNSEAFGLSERTLWVGCQAA